MTDIAIRVDHLSKLSHIAPCIPLCHTSGSCCGRHTRTRRLRTLAERHSGSRQSEDTILDLSD